MELIGSSHLAKFLYFNLLLCVCVLMTSLAMGKELSNYKRKEVMLGDYPPYVFYIEGY